MDFWTIVLAILVAKLIWEATGIILALIVAFFK